MPKVTFDEAFERVIGHEGKFQDNPKDRGNWTSGIVGVGELKGTKYGISAMSYPKLDIKNLTLEKAKEIYKEDFWDRAKADQYDSAIAFQLFDYAINHGIGNAIRMLQRAVGVVDDGIVGKITLAAISNMSTTDVIMRLTAERLEFIVKLSTWDEFGKGWVRRSAANLRYAALDT